MSQRQPKKAVPAGKQTNLTATCHELVAATSQAIADRREFSCGVLRVPSVWYCCSHRWYRKSVDKQIAHTSTKGGMP
jgi:hypothetical protein